MTLSFVNWLARSGISIYSENLHMKTYFYMSFGIHQEISDHLNKNLVYPNFYKCKVLIQMINDNLSFPLYTPIFTQSDKLEYNDGFQTLNCRYSFGVQLTWPKFCMALGTRYDLLS